MGRHRKDWDPEGFENSRKRQRKRLLAPSHIVDPPGLADEHLPSTTLPPPRSANLDMATPVPGSSQNAAPGPSRVSQAETNKILVTELRTRDGPWIECRVVVRNDSKKPGITQDTVHQHGLFFVPHPENKRWSTVEGPTSTDRIRTDYSTKITIRYPGEMDPTKEFQITANVWRSESRTPFDYEIRIPSKLKAYCELRSEEEEEEEEEQGPVQQSIDDGGSYYMEEVTRSEEFLDILGPYQHPDVSGDQTCPRCFDLAMLELGFNLGNRP